MRICRLRCRSYRRNGRRCAESCCRQREGEAGARQPHRQRRQVLDRQGGDRGLAARRGDVRFSVRDDGLGIPLVEQQRIFDKFHRLDPDMTRGVGGTGLGLYICKQLVDQMSGRIWVRRGRAKGRPSRSNCPPRGTRRPPPSGGCGPPSPRGGGAACQRADQLRALSVTPQEAFVAHRITFRLLAHPHRPTRRRFQRRLEVGRVPH